MTFKIQLIVYNYPQILHFRYLFNKLPINLYIQKLCERQFFNGKQTEFIFFLCLKLNKMRTAKIILSLSWYLVCQPEKYWYYQMHTPQCHLHTSVDLYLDKSLI